MIVRLKREPVKEALFHTQAILLAPSSLCLVSYLNFITNPSKVLVFILYLKLSKLSFSYIFLQ